MKRNLFVAFALTVGALCFFSCEKEKTDDGSVNQRLTLEQQQMLISQSLNLAAGEIDFSAIVPMVDAAQELDGIQLFGILGGILEDSVSGQALSSFISKAQGDTVQLDFSLLGIGMEFDLIDSTKIWDDDTTTIRIPVVVNSNYNADNTYILLNTANHKFQLNLLASSNNTSLEVETYSNEGAIAAAYENHLLIMPRQIRLEVVVDGKKCGVLELNVDTDFKIRQTKDGFSYEGNKMNLSVNAVLGDFVGKVAVTYSESAGITLTESLSVNKGAKSAEILGLTFKIDADMGGLGNSLNEAGLAAWAMNDSKLRGVELNMSFLDKFITGEFRLSNPIVNGKLPSSIMNIISADSVTAEMASKVVADIKPYIKSGLYFKGYKPAQASLEIVSQEISSDKFDEGMLAILNLYQLAPKIKISADNSLVGFDEYLQGIDIKSALQSVEASFNAAFSQNGITLGQVIISIERMLRGVIGGDKVYQ